MWCVVIVDFFFYIILYQMLGSDLARRTDFFLINVLGQFEFSKSFSFAFFASLGGVLDSVPISL